MEASFGLRIPLRIVIGAVFLHNNISVSDSPGQYKDMNNLNEVVDFDHPQVLYHWVNKILCR